MSLVLFCAGMVSLLWIRKNSNDGSLVLYCCYHLECFIRVFLSWIVIRLVVYYDGMDQVELKGLGDSLLMLDNSR